MASQHTFCTLFTLFSTIDEKYQQLGTFDRGTFCIEKVQKKVPHSQSNTYFLRLEICIILRMQYLFWYYFYAKSTFVKYTQLLVLFINGTEKGKNMYCESMF